MLVAQATQADLWWSRLHVCFLRAGLLPYLSQCSEPSLLAVPAVLHPSLQRPEGSEEH